MSMPRALLCVTASMWLAACGILPPLEAPKTEEQLAAEARRAEQEAAARAAREAARPSRVCGPARGGAYAYRKKVLVLAMPPQRQHEALDLPDIAVEWSLALQRRLKASDRFLVKDGSAVRLDEHGDVRQQVITLAQRHGAQFVVGGQLAALTAHRADFSVGSSWPVRTPWNDRRTVQAILEVYDGASGVRLARFEHGGGMQGDGAVNPARMRPLQGDFDASPLGRLVNDVLDHQFEDTLDALACMPMMAHIVRSGGDGAQIDAGLASNLRQGDRLQVALRQATAQAGGGGSGWVEQAYGEFHVEQVYLESAQGRLDYPGHSSALSGAVVRAW